MTLFTYCIKVDRGSAPNPFWGICTLAICKPTIRRVAQPGDWIVGFGSRNVDGVDYSNKVVYAMRIYASLSFGDYDKLCQAELPGKIPDMKHKDQRRHLGDCIFDFSVDPAGKLRPAVHTLRHRAKDLRGKNVLLSDHFFYFGNKPCRMPARLHPIIIQHQGHKSKLNDPYKEMFVDWIEANYKPNVLYGNPQVGWVQADDQVFATKNRC